MKKILALLALFAFAASPAFATIQISENGTNRGQFKKLNLRDGVTVDASGNVDFDALAISAGGAAVFTTISGTTATFSGTEQATVNYSTYYSRLPYYSKLTMIGSGAPAGSMIMRGGDAGKNCGAGGDGTTIYVCGSDGTNWKLV